MSSSQLPLSNNQPSLHANFEQLCTHSQISCITLKPHLTPKMIAGHYEYERQTGPIRGSSSSGDEILIGCFLALVVWLLINIFAVCCPNRQNAQAAGEPDTHITAAAAAADDDTIIVSHEDGYATGITTANPVPDDTGDVGQSGERLPQRGASPGRG